MPCHCLVRPPDGRVPPLGTRERTAVPGWQAIRALRVTRRSAVKSRTQAINQLRALLLAGPAELREQLRGLAPGRLDGMGVRAGTSPHVNVGCRAGMGPGR
jgi:hypothetical protein